MALGAEVFAIQDGGRCMSSTVARKYYAMYGKAADCSPDGEGDRLINQVYKIKTPPPFKTVGCWSRGHRIALTVLEGVRYGLKGDQVSRQQAVMKCYKVAKSNGFAYFAVVSDGFCLGDKTGNKYKNAGVSEACKRHGKGGDRAYQVYKVL